MISLDSNHLKVGTDISLFIFKIQQDSLLFLSHYPPPLPPFFFYCFPSHFFYQLSSDLALTETEADLMANHVTEMKL